MLPSINGTYGLGSPERRWRTLEAEAIRWYGFERGVDVQRVGLILTDDGKVGGSPDGLVGDDGLIEVKCYDAEHHMLAALDAAKPALCPMAAPIVEDLREALASVHEIRAGQCARLRYHCGEQPK